MYKPTSITITFTEDEWWAVSTALDSYLQRKDTADPRLKEDVALYVHKAKNKLRDKIAAIAD
jgi:uncharacterized protein YdaU (DUF1376 family)